MRIVAWNINQGRRDVWSELDRLAPDIALLTEVNAVPDGRQVIWNAEGTEGFDKKVRRFAAAVVSPHPLTPVEEAQPRFRSSVRPVPVRASKPGSWAIARIDVPGIGAVTAVSLYGLMDEMSDASMHRSLSDIAGVVDDPELGRNLVIGGDFNTGTQWPPRDRRWQAGDAGVLGRLSAWQLVDLVETHRPEGPLPGCPCSFGDGCRHTRTRRDPRRPETPYQTDYLYVSKPLAERVRDCRVLAEDHYFALSDHAPIVADLTS